MAPGLLHKTVFEAGQAITKVLSFTPEIAALHIGGSFPLARDPLVTRRAAVIGMLVLRQAITGIQGCLSPDELMASKSWAYGVRGIVVSTRFPVVPLRLSVTNAYNTTTGGRSGFWWQPFGWLSTRSPVLVLRCNPGWKRHGSEGERLPLAALHPPQLASYAAGGPSIGVQAREAKKTMAGDISPALSNHFPCLSTLVPYLQLAEILLIRRARPHMVPFCNPQKEGYLSSRRLPATIILTQSGDIRPDGSDFLDSRAIRER